MGLHYSVTTTVMIELIKVKFFTAGVFVEGRMMYVVHTKRQVTERNAF